MSDLPFRNLVFVERKVDLVFCMRIYLVIDEFPPTLERRYRKRLPRADIVIAALAFFARSGAGERSRFLELEATSGILLARDFSFERVARLVVAFSF